MRDWSKFIAAFVIFFFSWTVVTVFTSKVFAACFGSNLVSIGNTTVGSNCSIAANTYEANDYTTAENSVNTAVLTVNAIVTLNAGTGANTTKLAVGTITVGTGNLSVGGVQTEILVNHPVWVTDADVDGYAANFTLNDATAAGKRRVGLMRSAANADCNDGAYSTTNTCYSYGQGYYYGYGQGYYYGYGQGYYYGYGQGSYYHSPYHIFWPGFNPN